ncbi:MAG: hypothetical protein ACFFE2_13915 [Candidatus Thorarchaeota archaeon]
MDVVLWTLISCTSVIALPTLNYAFTWEKGPSVIQKLGSVLFNGMKRSFALYGLLVTMIYWTTKSYLSGFRLGLGAGITQDVPLSYLMISIGEWLVLIVMLVIVIAGIYRHPSFLWVFPPYSERLASIWVFRARVWNRSADSFKRFLLNYYERVEDSEHKYYQQAIEKMAEREDWIGTVAQDVLSHKFHEK